MDHASIGHRERTFKTHRGEALDRARYRRHDLGPAIGTGAPHRAGAERIETEADIAGSGAKAFAFHIFGDVNGGHPRLRTDLQFDGDTGIDIDAVQNLLDRFCRRLQSKTIGAIGAGEDQRQPGGAIFEIMQRLRIGLFGVGMIDPLHDLPGGGRRPGSDRRRSLRARINRIDLQSIGGLADELFERRALQHAVDQFAPVVVGRWLKIRRQPQIVSRGRHPPNRSLKPSLVGRKLPRGGRQAKRLFSVSFWLARFG